MRHGAGCRRASMAMILAFLVGVIVGIVLTVGYAMAQARW